MPVIITESQIYKEYQITATGTASAAQALAFTRDPMSRVRQQQRVILEAKGDDVVFKFGGADALADRAVTSNALADGNFSVTEGVLVILDVNGLTQTHVSAQSVGSGGTGIVRLCGIQL